MKRFPDSVFILLIIFVVSVTVSVFPSAIYGQEKTQEKNTEDTKWKDNLKAVPIPMSDHLEKAVSRQLSEKRQEVDALVKSPDATREQVALAYGELGQLYHAYVLSEAAEPCYDNALILDASNLEWRYSLGYLLQSVGRFFEALEHYLRMGTGGLNPKLDYLVQIRIGECYRSLNQPDHAKRAIEAAFRINPEGPAVLARLGEAALAEKRYDDAIKYLMSALEKEPAADKLHYSLGMAYRGAGDMEKARLHMSKYGMVDVQPADPLKTHLKKLVKGYHVHLLAGKLAFSAKRYNEAIDAFRKAIDADPEKAGAKIDMGAALVKLGKFKQALIQFEAAVKLAPDNVTAHFNIGMVYTYFANYTKAIEHFQIVVDKSPKDAGAHLSLANAFRNTQQFRKAIEHYKTALSIDDALTWGWVDLSSSLWSLGQHAEALKVLEDAHSNVPYDGPIAHALARLLATTPELEKRQGKKALKLALKVYGALESYTHAKTVAMAYAELNKCNKAVEWMEKAIELAVKSTQDAAVIQNLKSNLDYFKTNRPCRVPANQ